MVRSRTKVGLVLRYGAGPTGTSPKGTHWLWGEWGRFCALPQKDGSWHAYPLGVVAVSELVDSDSATVLAPPNKPLKLTTPPQGHWCNIKEPFVRRVRR